MIRALLRIDLQNDFMPGGALPVPEGDSVVPLVNQLSKLPIYGTIIDTQDWHPSGHCSFAVNHPGKEVFDEVKINGAKQVLWPVHCVQHTAGADFHPGLDRSRIAYTVRKGTEHSIDSYSGFYDNGHHRSTGLTAYLRNQGVTDVDVVGLALDYCVLHTALDAVYDGFNTCVIEDACRAITNQPESYQHTLNQLRSNGIQVLQSNQILP
jgi:nicotinamidase/pyrazinamidase